MRRKTVLFLAVHSLMLLLVLLLPACSNNVTPVNNNTVIVPPTRTIGFTPTPGITLAPTPTNLPIETPTAAPTPGGNVVGAFTQDALTLHYYKNNNDSGYQYLKLLFAASLTRRNPTNLTLQGNAAEKWTVDNAQTSVTFTLKSGLKWSDGNPITTADYIWTYQQARKPENGWDLAAAAFSGANYPDSDGIENVTALDARTLVVKLKSYSFDIVSRADIIEPLPSHIWQNLDWNDPAKNPEYNKPTVVSGAWLLKDWKRGELITFVRNPKSSLYPVPNLDSLSIRIVADPQVAWEKMRQEELDFYSPPASEQKTFEDLDIVQPYKWQPAQATWQYIGFNFRNPLLQDKALRQALAYATDRKTILEKYAFGLGKLINSEVPPGHPTYFDNTDKYDFNLDKAKDILQKAGYTMQNGQLLTKDKQIVPPLRLVYNTPSDLREGIAKTLQQNYAALGIQLKIQTFDAASYERFLTNPNSEYDLFLGGWQSDFDVENFGEVWRNVPELNNGAYRNDKLINLYTAAQTEPDATKRRTLMAQVQQAQAQELPYIYLHAEQAVLDVSRRIGGIKPTLLGVNYNLYADWYVKG